MSWTLSTSGAAISKAGSNANSAVIASAATLAKWSDEAEGIVCGLTRKDWVTDYSNINASFKPMLDDTVSSFIAMKIISYDMSGYTSRLESQTILDVLRDDITRNIEALKDAKTQEKFF